MKIIKGKSRQQIQFSSLDEFVAADNPVRILDAFVEKLELSKLGINPDKIGGLNNHKQEPWKAPLPNFIEKIYFKQFKRESPLTIKPLAESMSNRKEKIASASPRKKNGKS